MKKLRLPEIKNKGAVILYACIAAGIVLRLVSLGAHPVTSNEFTAANFAFGDNLFQMLFNNAANNNEAPLYYLITYIWTAIFGYSEISVRILPAIFGIISVFIVHKLTRSFYSEKVSVIATSLFALSPFQLYYSQLSGGQTLLLITNLLMVYYFMLSVKYNSFVIGPFTFWSVASLYCGHMSLPLLGILNVILFIRYKEEIRINLWLRSQIFILFAWLPMAVYFIKGNFIMQHGAAENAMMVPFFTLKNLLLGYTMDFNFLTIAVMALASFFLLIGVITCRTVKEKRMTDIMSLIMFFTVILMWASSLLGKTQYADEKLLLAGTMLIIVLSIGLSHLSREGMVLFTLVTLTFFSVSIFNYFGGKKWQAADYAPFYAEIMHSFKEGAVIINASPDSYGPVEFYNKLSYKRNYPDRLYGSIPQFKGNAGVRENWRKLKLFLAEKTGMNIYGGYDRNLLTQEELKAKASSYSRVFLIFGPGGAPEQLDPEKAKWVRDYFKVSNKLSLNGRDMYTLDRR